MVALAPLHAPRHCSGGRDWRPSARRRRALTMSLYAAVLQADPVATCVVVWPPRRLHATCVRVQPRVADMSVSELAQYCQELKRLVEGAVSSSEDVRIESAAAERTDALSARRGPSAPSGTSDSRARSRSRGRARGTADVAYTATEVEPGTSLRPNVSTNFARRGGRPGPLGRGSGGGGSSGDFGLQPPPKATEVPRARVSGSSPRAGDSPRVFVKVGGHGGSGKVGSPTPVTRGGGKPLPGRSGGSTASRIAELDAELAGAKALPVPATPPPPPPPPPSGRVSAGGGAGGVVVPPAAARAGAGAGAPPQPGTVSGSSSGTASGAVLAPATAPSVPLQSPCYLLCLGGVG